MNRFIIGLTIYVLCPLTLAFAQAPDSLSFQGYVTSPDSTPLDTTVQIQVRLIKNGIMVWEETHPSVTVSGGVFNLLLGSVTPLNTLAFDKPMELRTKIGDDPWTSPNTTLASAAYALGMRGLHAVWADEGDRQSFNLVGGASNNMILAGVVGSVIAGGGGAFDGLAVTRNFIESDFSVISGGLGNSADGLFSVIGGGYHNIGGGGYATVGGGGFNDASGSATVGGGYGNVATGIGGTISGGYDNMARGQYSSVGGGEDNVASGQWAIVPGGQSNAARGEHSFAAGFNAKANHPNSFVWGGKAGFGPDSVWSSGPGEFIVRNSGRVVFSTTDQFFVFSSGGVGIGTGTPRSDSGLDVGGPIHAGGSTLLFKGTSAEGSTGLDDGVRLRYDGDFGGPGKDYLLLEKTDANQNAPDGGIAFVNTGADGVVETALQISGTGSVSVPGNLSKGSGSFKIDHPLDPQNRYLYHSFVESPDMMNVYNGNVILNEFGEATVDLPSYFEALNTDFRYQLTPIGAPGPNLYVAAKISDNQFRIAGGKPGTEVSWQVTGIRNDPYAAGNRIEVEVDKGEHERGTYLHPEAYGVPQ